ncbi:hypothetical protein EVAR_101178_1 [Eumeta japonica]|uniref:Reverse transcriptase domain-containing protein n=1 Tax=Eumeta variegata TaxID=151549 RepID=A0A4C1TH89_EUMVA|nr:hypothetical protein EVAR_101178_1 [Eumeta japonica]
MSRASKHVKLSVADAAIAFVKLAFDRLQCTPASVEEPKFAVSVKCVLYTDDQAIIALSACELQMMASKVNDSIKKNGLKVNVSETKVMVSERIESMTMR